MDFVAPQDEIIQPASSGGDFVAPQSEIIHSQNPIESAARGVLRNLPGAQQVAAMAAPINPFSDKKTYSEELSHLAQRAEEGKAQNPVSYGAGAIAGTAAPAFIPGVGPSLAANAAVNALQSQSDTDLTKATGQDVKDAAIAGGIGAGMSGLAKFFMPGAKPAAQAITKEAEAVVPQEAAQVAEKVATPTLQATPAPQVAKSVSGIPVPDHKIASDFVPSAERIYASNMAQGLGGTPRQLMKIFGKEDPIKSMNELGNWMDTAGKGGTSLHGLMDRPGELLGKTEDIQHSSGKVIGDIIKQINDSSNQMGPLMKVTGSPAETNSAAWMISQGRRDLVKNLLSVAEETIDPQSEARIMKTIKLLNGLDQKGKFDFAAIQKVKELVGKEVARDPGMARAYGEIAEYMKGVIDAYGNDVADPALKAAYSKAKIDFHNSSKVLPMLRYAEARELVGGPAGHHTLRSLFGTIINTMTGVSGLPPVEQLGKNVAMKAAPVARNVVQSGTKARGAVSKALPGIKVNPAIIQELSNFLTPRYQKNEK